MAVRLTVQCSRARRLGANLPSPIAYLSLPADPLRHPCPSSPTCRASTRHEPCPHRTPLRSFPVMCPALRVCASLRPLQCVAVSVEARFGESDGGARQQLFWPQPTPPPQPRPFCPRLTPASRSPNRPCITFPGGWGVRDDWCVTLRPCARPFVASWVETFSCALER